MPALRPTLLAALLALLAAAPARAQDAAAVPEGTVVATVDSTRSRIDYTGSAPGHDWRGTSRDVAGSLRLDLEDPTQSRVTISAPVASFDSGNSTRDGKMRRATEAETYPTVRFRLDSLGVEAWGRTGEGYLGDWRVAGPLTFHGQTHPVTATVRVRVTRDSVVARTSFPVSLTRFGVERPGFLFLTVDDTIRIEATVRGAIRRTEAPGAR